jgi:hypothetical protein
MIICAAIELFITVADPTGAIMVSTEARTVVAAETRASMAITATSGSGLMRTDAAGAASSREAMRAGAVAEMKAIRDRAIASGMALISVDAINAIVGAEREKRGLGARTHVSRRECAHGRIQGR